MVDKLAIANILGVVGGILLAICLIPEILHILVRRSAEDLSYSWLLLYLVGLILSLLYLVLLDALVGWITMIIEIAAVFLIMFLKAYYESPSNKKNLGMKKTAESKSRRHSLSRLSVVSRGSSSFAEGSSMFYTWAQTRHHRVPKATTSDITHRGMHVMLDYVFVLKDNVTVTALADFIYQEMQQACSLNSLNVVHKHLEMFSDEEAEITSPGFTSICLIDKSHVSAHCYSDSGMLAIDVFTCGNPRNAKTAADYLHQVITASPLFESIDNKAISAPRFPNRLTPKPPVREKTESSDTE